MITSRIGRVSNVLVSTGRHLTTYVDGQILKKWYSSTFAIHCLFMDNLYLYTRPEMKRWLQRSD